MAVRKIGFVGALMVVGVLILAPLASARPEQVSARCDGERQITIPVCLKAVSGD